MATVSRENVGVLTDKITVTVSKDDYLPAFNKALKEYSKKANLPGFRKGMVPAGLVKKMHGQALFADEVLRVVDREMSAYMQKEQLNIFAQPVPADDMSMKDMDMNTPAEYAFSFEIGLKPDFEVAPLMQAQLTRYKVAVTPEMVQSEVERLQNRHGKMTEPETVTSEEMVLNVTFAACDAEGNITEGGLRKDNSLLVKYFAPAWRQQLMGKQKGDHLVLQLNSAFEEKEREWVLQDLGLNKDDAEAGEQWFNMEITKVGLVEKREMEAELRNEIEAYWSSQSRNQLQDGIFHYLVDKTNFEIPTTFLKKWMMTGREKPSTAEQVEQEYPQFSQSLKWTLISDKLVQDNQISAGPEEIKDFARRQVMGYMGLQALDESHGWVEDYAAKMLNDKKFVEDTYHRIITEKLFSWAETQVTPVEAEISMDEFANMQKAHKH
jgi:trigger factor